MKNIMMKTHKEEGDEDDENRKQRRRSSRRSSRRNDINHFFQLETPLGIGTSNIVATFALLFVAKI